ncbi:ComF family protein [Oerskovia sp. Root918]|uniref:ComF family protein n=1 Tax=Oerskovia sp. Root918 TaxID=1736607 RepID=UPI000B00BB4D|nr:phosphoribosyltransferase family protein [Oerskovia sp. Root918]
MPSSVQPSRSPDDPSPRPGTGRDRRASVTPVTPVTAAGGTRPLVAALAGAAASLTRLVVPIECPGCGVRDIALCPACAGLLDGAPIRRERDAPRLDRLDGRAPLPVWACAPYAGPLRDVVVAWKDKGRVDLTGVLDAAAHHAGVILAPGVRAAVGRGEARACAGSGRDPVLVVPAPSTAAARRARGREPVLSLARALAQGLCAAGVEATPVRLLTQRGHDQVGRGSRGRGERLTTVRAPRRGASPGPSLAGAACLLVDDVLTTGATLAACERALEGLGAHVLGAFVVAATPPPRQGSAAHEVHLT